MSNSQHQALHKFRTLCASLMRTNENVCATNTTVTMSRSRSWPLTPTKYKNENKRYTFRTYHYIAHIAPALETSIKNPIKAFYSTRCVMIRAATVTTSRPAPLALLQDNTMHTLHVRAQVVDPVEPSRTEVTLVLQKIWVVNDTVPSHSVSCRKVFVADVTGKPYFFFLS